MDIHQARTFLAVAGTGSFLAAAARLHLTQSTVSARIRALETSLGARLFVRNRAGASLTPAGRRFERHAHALVRTLEQARYDVGLPPRFRASIAVGGRFALWEGFLPRWVQWMRGHAPDVSVRSEIGFEQGLMQCLTEGSLDIGLMYTPEHRPGLVVEHLFDETLTLLSADPDSHWPDDRYVYVDWGPEFQARHSQSFPDLERPALSANIGWLGVQQMLLCGGSCYLPIRVAQPLVSQGRLAAVPDSPTFTLPAYMVFPDQRDREVMDPALAGLRQLAAGERARG